MLVPYSRLSQIRRQNTIFFTCLLYLWFHLSYLTARKSGNVSCAEPRLTAVYQVAIIDTFLGTSDFKSESERFLSSVAVERCLFQFASRSFNMLFKLPLTLEHSQVLKEVVFFMFGLGNAVSTQAKELKCAGTTKFAMPNQCQI